MSSKARKTQKSVLNLQNQSPRLLGPPFKISWIHHWNEVDIHVFYYRALRSSVAEINSKVKTSGILRNFEKIVIWSTHYFKGSMKLRSLNIISWKMISKIQKLILQINYDRPIGLSVVLVFLTKKEHYLNGFHIQHKESILLFILVSFFLLITCN